MQCEYQIISSESHSTLEKKLTQEAQEGWRVKAMVNGKGAHLIVLMELDHGRFPQVDSQREAV